MLQATNRSRCRFHLRACHPPHRRSACGSYESRSCHCHHWSDKAAALLLTCTRKQCSMRCAAMVSAATKSGRAAAQSIAHDDARPERVHAAAGDELARQPCYAMPTSQVEPPKLWSCHVPKHQQHATAALVSRSPLTAAATYSAASASPCRMHAAASELGVALEPQPVHARMQRSSTVIYA